MRRRWWCFGQSPARPLDNRSVANLQMSNPLAVNNNTIISLHPPHYLFHPILMPRRKRARSETCATPESSSPGPAKRRAVCSSPPPPPPQRTPSPSLPLTQGNLQALEDSQKSSDPDSFPINADQPLRPAMSRPPSPTRPNNNLDTSLKLAAYQILVDYDRELPLALKEHVSV
jgi:hypothetical protein